MSNQFKLARIADVAAWIPLQRFVYDSKKESIKTEDISRDVLYSRMYSDSEYHKVERLAISRKNDFYLVRDAKDNKYVASIRDNDNLYENIGNYATVKENNLDEIVSATLKDLTLERITNRPVVRIDSPEFNNGEGIELLIKDDNQEYLCAKHEFIQITKAIYIPVLEDDEIKLNKINYNQTIYRTVDNYNYQHSFLPISKKHVFILENIDENDVDKGFCELCIGDETIETAKSLDSLLKKNKDTIKKSIMGLSNNFIDMATCEVYLVSDKMAD